MGYRTIRVDRNERRVINVGSNETLENVLIDIDRPGAEAVISAMGTNWTVRNIGFKGEWSGTDRFMGCGDTGGGESVVENIYVGDGTANVGSSREPKLGLWVTPAHSGTLEIRGVNVQGARDNGIYASAPGSNGNGERGVVNIRNCYGKNNRVAHFRTAGGVVENCVAVNDSSDLSSTGGAEGRCIWGWPTRGSAGIEIRDCDFVCGGYPHAYDFGRSGATTNVTVTDTDYSPSSSTRFQGNVRLDETNVGHSPRDRIPAGCPETAEQAASGEGGEYEVPWREDHDREHTLEFEGTGEFWFKTEGGKITRLLEEAGPEDLPEHYVHGELNDAEAVFAYDTFLADVGFDGDVDVRINGEHEPTWSMYPGDGVSRDWLAEYREDDEDGGDSGSPPGDGVKLEEVLERLDALEASKTELESSLDEYDEYDERIYETEEAVETWREKLQKVSEILSG